MANVYSAKLAGKTGKPYGVGMRIVAGKIDLAFVAGIQTVSAADVGLKRLLYLSVSPGTTSERIVQTLVSVPGSVDNAGSVTVFAAGSQTAKNGTIVDASYLAIGE